MTVSNPQSPIGATLDAAPPTVTTETETKMNPGDKVYDVNTKQQGILCTQPRPADNGSFRLVAEVHWNNGQRMVVYTSHIRTYA
jgi:hypothetical protein